MPSVSGRPTCSSSLCKILPTVHAAPADFALGGEPLGRGFRRCRASLADCAYDLLRIARRGLRPTPPGRTTNRCARSRKSGCRGRGDSGRWRRICEPASERLCGSSSEPIAEAPTVGPQTGATSDPMTQVARGHLIAHRHFFRSSSDESMSVVRKHRVMSTPCAARLPSIRRRRS